MSDYTSIHRTKMRDQTRISKTKLERGMVAKIRYKRVDGETLYYYVFVLQPDFRTKFHCLDLKHISPPLMTKMASTLKEVVSITPMVKKLDLTKLDLDVASKKFYLNEIKNKKLKVGYRTLIEKNITSVTVYNYDYGVFDRVDTRANRESAENAKNAENDGTPDFLQGI